MTAADSMDRVDTLSLADCYGYDPRPLRSGGYLRFKCPLHGGDHQKSLSVKEETGKFTCHGCGSWGTVTENRVARADGLGGQGRFTPRKPELVRPEPLPRNDFARDRAKDSAAAYLGSPAQQYAQFRGIPDEIARTHGLGHWRGVWQGCDSEWLTFPMRCPITGFVIGVYGRNIHSNEGDVKARLLGKRGCFGATKPGSMPDDVILCEGPFEAIACLLSPDLPPARAFFGCMKRPEWFDDCRRVVILGDDDEPDEKGRIPGKEAVDRLVAAINERNQERKAGPRVLALPHGVLRQRYGVKDLGDLLKLNIPIILNLPPIAPLVAPVPDYLAFLNPTPAPKVVSDLKTSPMGDVLATETGHLQQLATEKKTKGESDSEVVPTVQGCTVAEQESVADAEMIAEGISQEDRFPSYEECERVGQAAAVTVVESPITPVIGEEAIDEDGLYLLQIVARLAANNRLPMPPTGQYIKVVRLNITNPNLWICNCLQRRDYFCRRLLELRYQPDTEKNRRSRARIETDLPILYWQLFAVAREVFRLWEAANPELS